MIKKVKELYTAVDVLTALLEGYILSVEDTEEPVLLYHICDGAIKRYNTGELALPEFLHPGFNSPVYAYALPNWWEAIPEKGRICWVSDIDKTGRVNLAIISRGANSKGLFRDIEGVYWTYATPVLKTDFDEYSDGN